MKEKKTFDVRQDRFIESISGQRALKAGDPVHEFELIDQLGRAVAVRALLERGPLIISFYMGGWCTYSVLELIALQRYHERFESAGAQLITVTPELPDRTLTTIEEHDLTFPVLSDIDNEVAAKFGLLFTIPEELKAFFNVLGFYPDLSKGAKRWQLPVPATYIVRPDGVVEHAFISSDYTRHMEPEEILLHVSKMGTGRNVTV